MLSPLLRQTWAVSGVIINMFGQGLILSYPTSLLPTLQRADSTIKSDLNTSSWLGAIVAVSGVIGLILSSFLMGLFGRKLAHFLAIIPAIVGWLIIYFATNITMLMIGRFLCGMATMGTVSLGSVVIGEFTCPKYRGVFLTIKNASVCISAMFMHIIALHLHWRTIALVCIIPLILALVIISTWPESPAWLASKQQYESSEAAFLWLRGSEEKARREIKEMIIAQKEKFSKSKRTLRWEEKVMNIFRKFTQKDFIAPCMVVILATAVLELSGRHVFPSYAPRIVAEITGETSKSLYCTLALDITITISSLLASIFIKKMNRRTLLFTTGFASVFVLSSICVYNFLTIRKVIASNSSWLTISLFIIYCGLANLGCAPIPLALVGEIFPLAHKELGVIVSGLWISLCLLGGLYSTPHLIVSIGVFGYFAVYGSLMGGTLVILYFIMPETKDKTLQEIENYFHYGKFVESNDDLDVEQEVVIKMLQ